jgi:hypothetical protein
MVAVRRMSPRDLRKILSSAAALVALVVALVVPAASLAQTVDPAGSGSVTPGQGIGDAVQQSCGFGKKSAKSKSGGAKKKQSCSRKPKNKH